MNKFRPILGWCGKVAGSGLAAINPVADLLGGYMTTAYRHPLLRVKRILKTELGKRHSGLNPESRIYIVEKGIRSYVVHKKETNAPIVKESNI